MHPSEGTLPNEPTLYGLNAVELAEKFTSSLSPSQKDIVKHEVLFGIKNILETKSSDVPAVTGNELGHQFAQRLNTQSEEGIAYGKVAVEAYTFAFDIANPYGENRTILAANILQNIYALSGVQTEQDWLRSQREVIDDARTCIVHFKNLNIYKQSYEQAQKNNFQIEWDQDALENYQYLAGYEQMAQELLG